MIAVAVESALRELSAAATAERGAACSTHPASADTRLRTAERGAVAAKMHTASAPAKVRAAMHTATAVHSAHSVAASGPGQRRGCEGQC
jgi:hypothetical protein